MWTRFRSWFSDKNNKYRYVINIGVVLLPIVMWLAYGFYVSQSRYNQRFLAMHKQIELLQNDLSNRDQTENAMMTQLQAMSIQMSVVAGTNQELAGIIGLNSKKLKAINAHQNAAIEQQKKIEIKINQIHKMDSMVANAVDTAVKDDKKAAVIKENMKRQSEDLRKASGNVYNPN